MDSDLTMRFLFEGYYDELPVNHFLWLGGSDITCTPKINRNQLVTSEYNGNRIYTSFGVWRIDVLIYVFFIS